MLSKAHLVIIIRFAGFFFLRFYGKTDRVTERKLLSNALHDDHHWCAHSHAKHR